MFDFGETMPHHLPGNVDSTLPTEINAATRPYHIALNRLITARLPLCLPPHTRTPRLYVGGISVLGTIYIAFEREWQSLLEDGLDDAEDERILNILYTLYIPALLRSERLRHDWSLLRDTKNGEVVELRGEESAVIQRYGQEIRQSIREKPQKTLAYAWTMYMALFNGGRWIRDQLLSAGSEFWQTSCLDQPQSPSVDFEYLSFWHFEGDTDGEDIKDEFKQRFQHAAAQLTSAERQDVMDEAVEIFKMCTKLVEWLDEKSEQPPLDRATWYNEWYGLAVPAALAAVSGLFGIWLGIWTVLASVAKRPWQGPARGVLVERQTHVQ